MAFAPRPSSPRFSGLPTRSRIDAVYLGRSEGRAAEDGLCVAACWSGRGGSFAQKQTDPKLCRRLEQHGPRLAASSLGRGRLKLATREKVRSASLAGACFGQRPRFDLTFAAWSGPQWGKVARSRRHLRSTALHDMAHCHRRRHVGGKSESPSPIHTRGRHTLAPSSLARLWLSGRGGRFSPPSLLEILCEAAASRLSNTADCRRSRRLFSSCLSRKGTCIPCTLSTTGMVRRPVLIARRFSPASHPPSDVVGD